MSLKKNQKKRTEWFSNAKFGMFIRFGLYSQLGGEWKGKLYSKTSKEDKYHYYSEWIAATAEIAPQEYSGLTTTFNPTKFDADLIAKTDKAAGMKCIVITTKTLEGFCL